MNALHVRNTALALMAGGWLLAAPVYADKHGKDAMGDQKAGMTQMSGMMHDMADHMMGMSGEMGKGGMNAAQQKHMSERMRNMSLMMDDMSGMMGKGMMMDGEQHKKMQEMRKQMDAMNKAAPPAADAKKKQHLHPRDGK